MSTSIRPVFAIAIAGAFLLTACSGGGSQTESEACDSLKSGVTQLSTLTADGVTAAINGDTDTAAGKGREIRELSASTADGLTNDKVKQAFSGVRTAFDGVADVLTTPVSGTDAQSQLETATNAVQSAAPALIAVCDVTGSGTSQ